jgi:ATPase subunit of ABC transporter with duplicated ATPase domains
VATRVGTKATRRALGVSLSLALPMPALPERVDDVAILRDVSAYADDRCLFASIDLRVARQRIAVVGANGAGKTTFLDIVLGRRAPMSGSARCDPGRVGAIAQGGADWMLDESLVSYLGVEADTDDLASLLVAHKFPLALGERPLRSLSPGERARAALICLFRRPGVELLVLDEPTYSLDLVGQRAVTEALRAWPGGLMVASHDRAFLSAIGVDTVISLGA